jgi:hypothetical protein
MKNQGDEEEKSDWWEKFLYDINVTDLMIAAFTGLLVFYTYLLWRATNRLASLERPSVDIDASNHYEEPTHGSTIDVKISNLGRAVAFAGEIQGAWFIAAEPPRQFRPGNNHNAGVY